MNDPLHVIFIVVSALLLLSIFASKLATRFGIPALLLFILIGIGVGSEGFGGVEFDNPQLTQSVGVVALVFILFSGGLDTRWQSVQSALKEGLLLSTVGVGLTAVAVAWLAHTVLGFSWEGGILLGATMASTDAAAVFSVLRGKNVNLKGKLQPVLELESGSNDPMAVFLTLGMIQLITLPNAQPSDLIVMFVVQMSIGAIMGVAVGFLMLSAINRLRLEYDGLYPVLTISFVLLCYGLTSTLGGNGFLAIYLTGLIVGRGNVIHKNSLLDFHDGLAWLMQIAMFILLGLQVFPSRLVDVAGVGLLVAIFLIFVARPLSVFIALTPLRVRFREMVFISWVGLRGAAPIILATFTQIAGISLPLPIFDLVFFVVLVSVLLQGTTIVPVARWLGLYESGEPDTSLIAGIRKGSRINDFLLEIRTTAASAANGMQIIDLQLPKGTLIVLINRQSEVIVPQGSTTIEAGDQILFLTPKDTHALIRRLFTEPASP
ncbi:MAG: potassium/proton antiporter [Anaerolineaceae bacterium]|nr:potassium/proton antiporter [Anaerolineaceae bacterium]